MNDTRGEYMKRCPKCKNELFSYNNKIEGRLCLIERCPECEFHHKNWDI